MDQEELVARLALSGQNKSWLADQLGVRPNTVYRWLNGSMAIPSYRDTAIREALPLAEVKS
jgi:DNA-binding transcriptional regulator YdaS (Cro superfamily)